MKKKENRYGHLHTDETKELLSEKTKKLWKDPIYREKQVQERRTRKERGYIASPETRKLQSDNTKQSWKDPKIRIKRLEGMQKSWDEDIDRHLNLIANLTGHKLSDDSKAKLSKSKMGKEVSQETKEKISIKITEVWKDPIYRLKNSGSNHVLWQGNLEKKYCHKFSESFKEIIRERYNRTCFFCGKSEKDNSERLCVHHIDYNKNSICNGKSWPFIPLCRTCHPKTNFNRWYWFNLLISFWLENDEIHLNISFINPTLI